ncbi:DUF421 domain-containing protein [Brevibacillus fulvus]|uniref:Uncharacterized membrane protein YcaP (DUF421 family) n=1 Tax=Brevibacillus fulvus TaxID=1125967 RepID=A0A938Y6B1_9BACL|nr:DUF421 domain-containing protein [Brevibacillus fulvus]MBM7592045.1 uncharacterized membrane protein YcaP (DUF421 family) [Brevibacillus fulvus]
MPEYILILIRAVLAFFVLMAMTKLMGNKQISHLTFFDYVVGITIGSIAASLSSDQGIKILNGLVGILVWAIFPIVISLVNFKSYKFRRLTDGHPTVLVENGMILEQNMAQARLTTDELMLYLREKNAFQLADVEFAVLETNGNVSVLLKKDAQPVTAKMLNLAVKEEHAPRIVIMDGVIMQKTLQKLGFTAEWLLGEIRKQGAKNPEDVFLGQITSDGQLYVDLKQDKLKGKPVPAQQLMADELRKVQAMLEKLALGTRSRTAKTMYQKNVKRVKQLQSLLAPYLDSPPASKQETKQ